MLVSARGASTWYNNGMPVSFLNDDFIALGQGAWPVVIFLVVAALFHILMRYTKYGKHTYAIGSNEEAARVAGINITRHKIIVYSIAGGLAGLAGVVTAARAMSAQAGMGMMYELDAIAESHWWNILIWWKRKNSGTLFGVLILGVITSGFVFLRIDAYYQEMVKGAIIVGAVVVDQIRYKKKNTKDKDI